MTVPRFELTSQRQKFSRLPTEPPGSNVRAFLNDPNFFSKIKNIGAKKFEAYLVHSKDVTWASKLSTHARVSGSQKHVPARAGTPKNHQQTKIF